MYQQMKNPKDKLVHLEGDLYELVRITANAKLIGFDEQLNSILSLFFFGEQKNLNNQESEVSNGHKSIRP
jgi:hypothetical protein